MIYWDIWLHFQNLSGLCHPIQKLWILALILFLSRSISIRTGNELVDNFHALLCPLRRISVFTVGRINLSLIIIERENFRERWKRTLNEIPKKTRAKRKVALFLKLACIQVTTNYMNTCMHTRTSSHTLCGTPLFSSVVAHKGKFVPTPLDYYPNPTCKSLYKEHTHINTCFDLWSTPVFSPSSVYPTRWIFFMLCTQQVWWNKAIYCAVLFSVPYKAAFTNSHNTHIHVHTHTHTHTCTHIHVHWHAHKKGNYQMLHERKNQNQLESRSF